MALTASRCLARGIIENPPRDIAVRIERAGGAVAVPVPLSDAERQNRIAQVNSYADELGRLAALSKSPAAGFVKRMSDTFFAASKTLRGGKVIVSVKSILDTPAGEPDSLQASLDFMSGKAREAWQTIQNQEPKFRASLRDARETEVSNVSQPFNAHIKALVQVQVLTVEQPPARRGVIPAVVLLPQSSMRLLGMRSRSSGATLGGLDLPALEGLQRVEQVKSGPVKRLSASQLGTMIQ